MLYPFFPLVYALILNESLIQENSSLTNSSFLFLHFIESEQEIFQEVLHGDLNFSSDPWPVISESAKDLIRRILVRDPKKRLTAREVLCKYLHLILVLSLLEMHIIKDHGRNYLPIYWMAWDVNKGVFQILFGINDFLCP